MAMSNSNAAEGVAGLVLAAGGGSRFGSTNKLLAPLHGRPLLEYALQTMASAGLASVTCVLGSGAAQIMKQIDLDLRGTIPLVCTDWAEGQSASLRAGIKALRTSDAVVITLGDQPLISTEAISRVVTSRSPDTPVVQAEYAGIPGHPVLLEHELFPSLIRVRGDRGARDLIAQTARRLVRCDGLGSPRDVDTPAELEAVAEVITRRWRRAGRSRSTGPAGP
jgi:CTP:molybdopterin cytidylyltransferase MocA